MANDATKVRVGLNGSVVYFDATSSATLPTNAATPLDAAWDGLDVGHIGEEGFSYNEDLTDNEIVDSAGDVVRKFVSEHNIELGFVMLETNDQTQRIYFGDPNATEAEVTLNNYDGARGRWVIESLDGDEVTRFVLSDAQVTGKEEINFQNTDAIGYGVTITSYISGGDKGKIYRGTTI